MAEYYVPARDSQAEFTEKRSRFIGHVWRVETEEEAREKIAQMKAKYYDARHNCWCYILREGGVTRYSDDGEPQGTAGQPMLEVFRREGVENVCCVVTRYFGGILLGTGGLLRAYTKSAKDALAEAGVAVVRQWAQTAVECPYNLLERMKLEIAAAQGILGEIEYGAQVRIPALLPVENWPAYEARITELTAGKIAAEKLGETFQAVPTEGK
ncbi:MAG: YigZ family protein [Clostridiales bacterium]|nr:YigZ family protein [Clostridiales bacterium]MDY4171569.1 YigZ family protein [Evtepia sp.]